jgi:hypothetical protein
MLDRRLWLAGALVAGMAAAVLVGIVVPSLAHHGWAWAEDGDFELTGVIVSTRLGNPHGLLTLNANGEDWEIEVGQPWRNERAGLKDSMLVKGVELIAQGHRAREESERRMKAERIIIAGKRYDLYPDRD